MKGKSADGVVALELLQIAAKQVFKQNKDHITHLNSVLYISRLPSLKDKYLIKDTHEKSDSH